MTVGEDTYEEFAQAVNQSKDVHEDDDLVGTKMGVTVGTLLEYGESKPDMTVYLSQRNDVPYPLGIDVHIEDLSEMADLIETFGPSTLSDIDRNDDGTLNVGYHFD